MARQLLSVCLLTVFISLAAASSHDYAFRLLKTLFDTTESNQLIAPLALKLSLLATCPLDDPTYRATLTGFLYSLTDTATRKHQLLLQYEGLLASLSKGCYKTTGLARYDCKDYLRRMRLPENMTHLESDASLDSLFTHFESYGIENDLNQLDLILLANQTRVGSKLDSVLEKYRLKTFWINADDEEEEIKFKDFTETQLPFLSSSLGALPSTPILLSVHQFRQTYATPFLPIQRNIYFHTNPADKGTSPITIEGITSRNTFPFFYSDRLAAAFVALPYMNPKYKLVIVRPDNGAVGPLLKAFSADNSLATYLEKMANNTRHLTLSIPRFFGRNVIDLTGALSANGLSQFTVDAGSKPETGNVHGGAISVSALEQSIYFESLASLEKQPKSVEYQTLLNLSKYASLTIDRPFLYFVTSQWNGNVEIVLAGYFAKVR